MTRQQCTTSCRVGDSTPSEVNLNVKDMPGPLFLEVTAIDCYDHNPRLFANEKAEDIEASIRANGYTDALVVTRRREGDRFMLAARSDTSAAGAARPVAKHPGRALPLGELHLPDLQERAQTARAAPGENLNRGDMRFWEVASGMTTLLDQLDAQAKAANPSTQPMRLLAQAEALNSLGLRAGKSEVALWRFAVNFLGSLGPRLPSVTIRAVKDHLQPRLNALKVLAAKFKIDEATYWDSVVHPTLEAYGQSHAQDADDTLFDAATLCDQIEAAFAENVGESVASIRQMLSMLKLSPTLTLADLRMPSPNLVVGRRSARVRLRLLMPKTRPTTPRRSPISRKLPWARLRCVVPPSTRPLHRTALSPTQTRPAATGPLFADAQDALQALHAEVQSLLASAELEDTLRWRDRCPWVSSSTCLIGRSTPGSL